MSGRGRKFFNSLIFIAFLAAFFAIGVSYSHENPPQEQVPLDPKVEESLDDFADTVAYIREFYVQEEDESALLENAIKGMLASLDPHSSYLDVQDFQTMKSYTTGDFAGIGVEVTLYEGNLRVITPIDGSPAAEAGLLPGDVITRLDDTAVQGLSLQDAVDKIRGKKGSEIKLTVVREKNEQPMVFHVTREIVHIHSVKHRLIDNQFGYIRISQFQMDTGDDVIESIKDLKKEAEKSSSTGNMRGLVLDLRNNPGGTLESSVKVSDAFLDKSKLKYHGLIVSAKGRVPEMNFSFKADGQDYLDGLPMVVLINGGSASASEIVAGALQDQERALIMGETSFGKGSVQSILPFRDEKHGLKLTTALYYTPSGRSIQAIGITPDIVVKPLTVAKSAEPVVQGIHEKDLDGHLKNSTHPKGSVSKTLVTKGVDTQDSTSEDYQLHQAINLLKGVVVMSRN